MRIPTRLLACALALSATAGADTITSEVSGSVEGVAIADSDTTSALFTPILASGSVPLAFPGTAEAEAAQQIGVLGAKGAVAVGGLSSTTPGAIFADGSFGPAPDGHFLEATNTLVSAATVAGPHKFSILLTGARLKLLDFAGAAPGVPGAPTASFSILATLTAGGSTTTIFAAAAVLNGGLGGHVLTETGQDLGGVLFGGGTEFGYDFDPFATELDLGPLDAGDFVEYTMSVRVSAAGFELGGLAVFGDPNDLDTQATTLRLFATSGPAPGPTPGPGPGGAPVPEPGTLLLVAAAGLSAAWRRRRTEARR